MSNSRAKGSKQVFENPTLFRNAPCLSVVTSVRTGAEMSVELVCVTRQLFKVV